MRQIHQQGSSTLAMIMMLLILGLLSLNALHRQLDSALIMGNDERFYLQAYNQAFSSLSWGLTRTWPMPYHAAPPPVTMPWYCEEQRAQGIKACIKPSASPGFFVIKGESTLAGNQQPITLYQRAKPEHQSLRGKIKMVGIARGWSDFCPEKDEEFCAG